MKESGVIDKTTMVFGQMNEPPGARMRDAGTDLQRYNIICGDKENEHRAETYEK